MDMVTFDEACRRFGVKISDLEIYRWFEPFVQETEDGSMAPFEGGWPRAVIRDFDTVRLSDFKRFLELRASRIQ